MRMKRDTAISEYCDKDILISSPLFRLTKQKLF